MTRLGTTATALTSRRRLLVALVALGTASTLAFGATSLLASSSKRASRPHGLPQQPKGALQ